MCHQNWSTQQKEFQVVEWLTNLKEKFGEQCVFGQGINPFFLHNSIAMSVLGMMKGSHFGWQPVREEQLWIQKHYKEGCAPLGYFTLDTPTDAMGAVHVVPPMTLMGFKTPVLCVFGNHISMLLTKEVFQ